MKTKLMILGLAASLSHAEGIGSLKYPLATNHEKTPEFGLYINEPIKGRLYYQSYTGYRVDDWLISYRHAMIRINNRLSLGIGPSYSDNKKYKNDIRLEGTLEWKLWR